MWHLSVDQGRVLKWVLSQCDPYTGKKMCIALKWKQVLMALNITNIQVARQQNLKVTVF